MKKIKDKDSSEWLAYLDTLEKERNDMTWTKSKPSEVSLNSTYGKFLKRWYKLQVLHAESMREQRDKLFFNAGRYAAGDRDTVAKAASDIVSALLDGEV
jgi:hypothetical protein